MKNTRNLIFLIFILISYSFFTNTKYPDFIGSDTIEHINLSIPEKLAEKHHNMIPMNKNIILGYIIDGYTPSEEQLKNITHLAISFLRPKNSEGNISLTSGWQNIDHVIALAKKNNVKTLISFGGGEFKITPELMGVYQNRKNLINNILDFMEKHNLDGFDCDWEPSWENNKIEMEQVNNTINRFYFIFIREFRKALDNKFGEGSKSFSAAVLNKNSIWYSQDKQVAHFPQNGWWNYLDWISLMNYDNELGSGHATFNSVFGPNGSISHWIDFGIPKSKIVTGIPFYARAGWGEDWLFYKEIIELYPEILNTVDLISYNKNNTEIKDYGFNGISTVTLKVKEAKKLNLAGVMMWQLDGDVPFKHKKSLLRAISNQLRN